jgi:hypothetical protein
VWLSLAHIAQRTIILVPVLMFMPGCLLFCSCFAANDQQKFTFHKSPGNSAACHEAILRKGSRSDPGIFEAMEGDGG